MSEQNTNRNSADVVDGNAVSQHNDSGNRIAHSKIEFNVSQNKVNLNTLQYKYKVSKMRSTLFSGIVLGYWNNLMGPLISKIWIGNDKVAINEDIINYVSNHTLTGELCRPTDTHTIDPKIYILSDLGYIFYAAIFNGLSDSGQAVSSLSFIMPYEEFERYLMLQEFIERHVKMLVLKFRVLQSKDKDASVKLFNFHLRQFVKAIDSISRNAVPSKICIVDTVFGEGDQAVDSKLLDQKFLVKLLTSHLQTCGCTVVQGSKPEDINLLIRTLSLFSSTKERACSRLASVEKKMSFTRELYIQGIVKISEKVEQIATKDVLLNTFPVTFVDIDNKTVRQSSHLHEHGTDRQKLIKVELELLLQGLDDSVYSEINPFADELGDDSVMVQRFISELVDIPNRCEIRKSHVDNFLRVIKNKANCLVSYVEAKSNYGQTLWSQTQMQQMCNDLSLTFEPDLRIILAAAEKIRPHITEFLLGAVSRKDTFQAILEAL